MDIKIVTLPGDKITDWQTFHSVFQEVFGFPGYYGHNMDAWIDCMRDIDDPGSGQSSITVDKNGLIVIRIDAAENFRKRCPEQYEELVACTASVNHHFIEKGRQPKLALMPIGR